MFLVRKGEIRKVRVVSSKGNLYSVYDKKSSIMLRDIQSIDLSASYSEAEKALKEMEIKKTFKKRSRGKKGIFTCAWCGKKSKALTVDHITPLIDFGGKKAIRKNNSLWNKAWSFKNLQMMCEECNQRKNNHIKQFGKMSLNDVDYHARILNNKKTLKKSVHNDSPANKVGYCIATGKWAKNRKEFAEYVAKADSNVLRLDMILSSTEAYDALPKTI